MSGVIKVLSETERTVTQTTGGRITGTTETLTCRKTLQPTSVLTCRAGLSVTPWVFLGNKFVRAFMQGGSVGGDPNIKISYGTCTAF